MFMKRQTILSSVLAFGLILLSFNVLAANPKVLMETSMGDIELELFQDKSPKTVENFLAYVKDGFYDGTVFHRVIKKFMIQGGGFDITMKRKKTRDPIKNEADNGEKNLVGTIAMARTSFAHSATAQFFINTKDNHFLNFRGKSDRGWGYAVFGKVSKGMDVVRKIEAARTGVNRGMRDVPVKTIKIEKMSIME